MSNQTVFIITGTQGEGKTTRLKEVVELLRRNGKSFLGFVAEGEWQDGKRTAFSLVNIHSGKSFLLCSSIKNESWIKTGRFFFNPKAIASGKKWLDEYANGVADFAIIDEIGIFELDNKIWHTSLQKLLKQSNYKLIITVRQNIIDRVIRKYNMENAEIFSLENTAENIVERVLRIEKKEIN